MARAGGGTATDVLELWEKQFPLPSETGSDVCAVVTAKTLYRCVLFFLRAAAAARARRTPPR